MFAGAVGLLIGSRPLDDNSFLTHLATGRLIIDGQGFPRADPYTFTAAGEPWVVQSWLASVLYGALDELGGLDAVRVFTAVMCGLVALVCWQLSAPAGSALGRLLAWSPVAVVGVGYWVERPLIIGLLLLGVTLLAAEGRLDARWLVPAGWVWVNSHGSWPLGLGALLALAVGRRLDDETMTDTVAATKYLVVGLLVGAANPYGPQLLVFPFELLSRRESLRVVAEWQPPRFDNVGELAFLAVLALALVALRRRPSWTVAVPLIVFTLAGLLGARNVGVAAVVLLPGVARGLAGLGGLPERLSAVQGRMVGAAAAALTVTVVIGFASSDPFEAAGYPVEATAFLVAEGLEPPGATIVTHDFVGNYFEARFGRGARVFIDDRVEVLPARVIDDYRSLLSGEPGWDAVLDHYEPDVVLWGVDQPLAELLRLSPGWELAYEDELFAVFVPS